MTGSAQDGSRASPGPQPGAEAPPQPDAAHQPAPVDWATESVAGEEDPGATVDLAIEPPAVPRTEGSQAPSGGKPAS